MTGCLLTRQERSKGQDWCLFLDRDGVINRRIVGSYVTRWGDFEFLPGALEALARLAEIAPWLVVVTNQQGVGKGVMSTEALEDVHHRMLVDIRAAGGRVDAVLACPHPAASHCRCRKPRTGLAESWLAGRPAVDRARSVVVGDSASDLEMGRTLTSGRGTNVWISGSGAPTVPADLYDVRCSSLHELAQSWARWLPAEEVACASGLVHR